MIRRVLNVLGIIIASTILLVGCSTGSELSLDKVKTIELGDTKEQVTSILGDPAEEKLGNYEYYSGNFLSIAEEMDANTEKFLNASSLKEMEQCLEKEKQLQEKLDSTVGQYICIEFRDEKVYSIFYDNNKIGVENNSQAKVVDSYQVISGTVLKYLRVGTVVYEVSYQDGSYLKATTSATVNDSENTYSIGINVGASWKDQWKNNFEGTLKVEFNEKIISGTGFYILDNVVHIIGDDYRQIVNGSSHAYLREKVTEIVVEDSVKRLEVMLRFPNARKITLPNTLEYIGNVFSETEYYKAFYRYNIGGGGLYYNDYLLAYQSTMYSSQEVEIKNNVRLIAAGAFSGNTRITSVVLPDSVQAIEDYTFSNCSNLVSVTIPNGVTRIGEGVFNGCGSLTSITLPKSVSNIGKYAIRVKEIIYKGSKEDWNRININEEDFNLLDSVWFYSEEKPSEEGNFWHYVDGKITVWN